MARVGDVLPSRNVWTGGCSRETVASETRFRLNPAVVAPACLGNHVIHSSARERIAPFGVYGGVRRFACLAIGMLAAACGPPITPASNAPQSPSRDVVVSIEPGRTDGSAAVETSPAVRQPLRPPPALKLEVVGCQYEAGYPELNVRIVNLGEDPVYLDSFDRYGITMEAAPPIGGRWIKTCCGGSGECRSAVKLAPGDGVDRSISVLWNQQLEVGQAELSVSFEVSQGKAPKLFLEREYSATFVVLKNGACRSIEGGSSF